MSIGLDLFVQQQLDTQNLTVKEFARRSGLGLSHAYQILRGQRNTRPSAETFDAVARGLSMTPAEMAVAMGRMAATHDPDEDEAIAIYRQVPTDQRTAAKSMLLGLVLPINRGKANRVRDGRANRKQTTERSLPNPNRTDESGLNHDVTATFGWMQRDRSRGKGYIGPRLAASGMQA